MEVKLSYLQAIELAAGAVSPIRTEAIPLAECMGRVLAQTVFAAADVPPFDRSPYDGYALRAQDVQEASTENSVTLSILEEIPAGGVSHVPVTAGTAVKILTGAPIPPGADAVVMFEKTKFTESTVTLTAPLQSGDNIVRTGEDVRKGTVLAQAGQRIDVGLLGTLASQNITEPMVFCRPRVGILSTGSELVAVGGELEPGKIFDSNQYTLSGALEQLGCIPARYGIAADRVEAIQSGLEQALRECDAVVLTGGVSVGDYDLTPVAMEAAGAKMLFSGCHIKPGMACAYGVKDGKLICGLSGNPASSLTNFYLVAQPALRKLCGLSQYHHQEINVTLAEGFGKKSPVTRVLRGRLDFSGGTAEMHISKDQGNVVLSSTIGCNGMAVIPAGSGRQEPGTKLKGFLL